MMVANNSEQPMEPDVDALGASPRVHVVELPWRAVRVLEALTRLQGDDVSWTGPMREILRVSTYHSTRTVSDALADLEEAGLLLRLKQGHGQLNTYYLRTETPAGEPYVVRTAPVVGASGRDVVRAAGRRVEPLSMGSTGAATHVVTDVVPPAIAPLEPMQSASFFDAPSLSSDRRRPPLLPDAAASTAASAVASAAEALAVERLVSLHIDPEPDIVAELASLTGEAEADCWYRITKWAHREEPWSTPDFVRACLASTRRFYPPAPPAPAAGTDQGKATERPGQDQGKTSTGRHAGVRHVGWGELAAGAAAAVTSLVWGGRRRGNR